MSRPPRPTPVRLTGPKPPAYQRYAAAWAAVGCVLTVVALPALDDVPWSDYALFLALASIGGFILARIGPGYMSMQGPIALAAVWLFGWPAGMPIAAMVSILLVLARRMSVWVGLLAFGNAGTALTLAGALYHHFSRPPHAQEASWQQAVVLVAAGTLFVLANVVIAFVGRYLDSGDPRHVRWQHVTRQAGFTFLAYVPVSFVLALASSVGASAQLLTVSIWLITSFALKGVAEAREANARLEEALAEVHRLAVTDALTGLGNRRHFTEVFEQALVACRTSGTPLALLLLDLRGLKAINDRLGHPCGDEVLCETARVLRRALRPGDQAFRIGGDEFAVILPGTTQGTAVALGERLCAALETLGLPQAEALTTGATAGVAVFPDDGATVSQLISAADMALYAARAAGAPVGVGLHPPLAPALPGEAATTPS